MTKLGAIETEYQPNWDLTDLTVLTAGRYKAPAFPLEALGEFWAGWVSAHAEIASAPVDYVGCSLLAAIGSLIGNARNVSPWPGWTEPSVIWINLVGNPSSGKSPALDAPLALMRKLEGELGVDHPETIRQWEAQREAAKAKRGVWETEVKTAVDNGSSPPDMPADADCPDKPVMPRLCLSDTTPEALGRLMAAHPKGLLFYRDELSGLLGGFDRYGGGGERAMWLEAFQARPYTIDRVKHGEPIRIPNLSLSIVGGIQPDKLTATLLTGDDDGMAARFLYCWPEPVRPTRPNCVVNDDAALRAFRALMNLRMGEDEDGNFFPVTVRFADDAAALLQEFRESNHPEGQAAAGLYAGHVGKLPGLVARLSLVLTYLRWAVEGGAEPDSISKGTVGYAAHLVDAYFKPMSRRAFGDAALPEVDRHAASIARYIVRKKLTDINASTIRRNWKLPGLREARKVEAALKVLEETNSIRPTPSRAGTTPGRRTSDYEVNPQLLEATL